MNDVFRLLHDLNASGVREGGRGFIPIKTDVKLPTDGFEEHLDITPIIRRGVKTTHDQIFSFGVLEMLKQYLSALFPQISLPGGGGGESGTTWRFIPPRLDPKLSILYVDNVKVSNLSSYSTMISEPKISGKVQCKLDNTRSIEAKKCNSGCYSIAGSADLTNNILSHTIDMVTEHFGRFNVLRNKVKQVARVEYKASFEYNVKYSKEGRLEIIEELIRIMTNGYVTASGSISLNAQYKWRDTVYGYDILYRFNNKPIRVHGSIEWSWF